MGLGRKGNEISRFGIYKMNWNKKWQLSGGSIHLVNSVKNLVMISFRSGFPLKDINKAAIQHKNRCRFYMYLRFRGQCS